MTFRVLVLGVMIVGIISGPTLADNRCKAATDEYIELETIHNNHLNDFKNAQIDVTRELEEKRPETAKTIIKKKVIPSGEMLLEASTTLYSLASRAIIACAEDPVWLSTFVEEQDELAQEQPRLIRKLDILKEMVYE